MPPYDEKYRDPREDIDQLDQDNKELRDQEYIENHWDLGFEEEE